MSDTATYTSDIVTPQGAAPAASALSGKGYCSPEVIDLGKASQLLQGGSRVGTDNFSQTYGF
jgi:hypothetical protein